MRLILAFVSLVLSVSLARADLASFVAAPEPKAAWQLAEKSEFGACDVFTVKLTSQEWHGILWKHDLVVFVPKEGGVRDRMYLLNSGGQMRASGLPYGNMVATMMKAPVAILLGVPNQPLLEGKMEDDLIAETFVRYLATKDGTWPLLFPMVKSVVKSMDALQELSAKEWGTKVTQFIVGGASKRGWTSWLTAAVDPRVMAITPMVIDVLNMQSQMQRQVECFGAPSEQVRPYVARGLIPMPTTPEAKQLWQWVDPYTYRAKYTMPKLILLGNNDRYWAPDALNLYWDETPGPKWICYTPNAGHNLTTLTPEGKRGDPMRAVNATAAFVRHLFSGQPMPDIQWKHDDDGGKLRLVVTSQPAAKEVRVWRCAGPSKDLRNAKWEARTVELKDGRAEILEARPETGVISFFAELTYEIDGLPYTLSTQLRMAEAGKK